MDERIHYCTTICRQEQALSAHHAAVADYMRSTGKLCTAKIEQHRAMLHHYRAESMLIRLLWIQQ
jgi:hypothetical protein